MDSVRFVGSILMIFSVGLTSLEYYLSWSSCQGTWISWRGTSDGVSQMYRSHWVTWAPVCPRTGVPCNSPRTRQKWRRSRTFPHLCSSWCWNLSNAPSSPGLFFSEWRWFRPTPPHWWWTPTSRICSRRSARGFLVIISTVILILTNIWDIE